MKAILLEQVYLLWGINPRDEMSMFCPTGDQHAMNSITHLRKQKLHSEHSELNSSCTDIWPFTRLFGNLPIISSVHCYFTCCAMNSIQSSCQLTCYLFFTLYFFLSHSLPEHLLLLSNCAYFFVPHKCSFLCVLCRVTICQKKPIAMPVK